MKKILVVEDDKTTSLVLSARLKIAGYEVMLASNASDAVNEVLKEKPDLIILDIAMPGGSGFSVANRLNRSPDLSNIPIIFVTASKLPEMRAEAINSGAVAFFEKPYDEWDLFAAIEKACKHSK